MYLKLKKFLECYFYFVFMSLVFISVSPVQAEIAIRNVQELQDMKNNLAESYYLAGNIDCSETSVWNNNQGFIPIGNISAPFTGKFDGRGYSIENLTIQRQYEDMVGLFGVMKNAQAQNCKLKKAFIIGRTDVGALAGYADFSRFMNCSATGQVEGSIASIGGLIGEVYNGEGVESCSVYEMTIIGGSQVGGIIGRMWDGNINTLVNSSAFANIQGQEIVGGLVGFCKSGDILRSYSCGTVQGSVYVGGIMGWGYENAGIDNCYSSCQITANNTAGGLAGYFNAYHHGASCSYFSGTLQAQSIRGGGFGDYVAGSLSSLYWNADSNPELIAAGSGNYSEMYGKTDTELRQQSTFTGWNFETIWRMKDYPYFYWENSFVSDEVMVFQDFEADNGTLGDYGWTWGNSTAAFDNESHSGLRSWKHENHSENWVGTAVQAQIPGWNSDCTILNNDRLTFWIKSVPDNGADCTVGIKFFDTGIYLSNGVSVWTREKARFGSWTLLTVLFSQFPPDFQLNHVNKLEFHNANPGVYYYDDIKVLRGDRYYQGFDKAECFENGSPWAWNGTVSLSNEKFYEGGFSLKLEATSPFAGTGFNSQYEKYSGSVDNWNNALQSWWTVDLNPAVNDRLSFWVYSLADNQMDQPLEVQFFDNGNHFENPAKVWTHQSARYNRWTCLSVPFSDLPSTLNLKDINKIQFLVSWPGTYYIDSIKASGSVPVWNKKVLRNSMLEWSSALDATGYQVEENASGKEGEWHIIHEGSETYFQISRIINTSYRVRSLVKNGEKVVFISDWSEVLEYEPESVVIDKFKMIEEGTLNWTSLSAADTYEVQYSQSSKGPWIELYSGPYPVDSSLTVSTNTWYRVRALKNAGDEKTKWSPSQKVTSPSQKEFLKTFGKKICDSDGKEILLRGFNLGCLFLNEPWMTGLGDFTDFPDEHSVRSFLDARGIDSQEIMRGFQNSFIIENEDFDILMRMGVNLVRLPVYYKILMNDDGTFIPGGFDKMDKIIQACAGRGIYVLLDLHGAPGSQSNEFHTGRKDFNQLFNPTEGVNYRNLTIRLWKEIAEHYKNEANVLGYDLLNEPTGIYSYYSDSNQALNALWDFYHVLYGEIRAIDPFHIMVMEAVWDWNALPDPKLKGWENVIYQFHYYNMIDEMGLFQGNAQNIFDSHKDYLDQKLNELAVKQNEYDIPVMVGEFNGMGVRSVWEYYLSKFNNLGLSWTIWSYKIKDIYNWGIYSHTEYNSEYPDLVNDDEFALEEKLNKFNTLEYYTPNNSLKEIVTNYLQQSSVSSNLLVYYSFDNNEGDIVPDESGSGNAGSIIGSPSLENGVSGNAFYFHPGDLVRAEANPLSGASQFTISIWFKTETPMNNYKLASGAYWHGGNNASGWNVGTHYSEGWADNEAGTIRGEANWSRTKAFIPGEWNHLVVVYSGDKVREYINGELSLEVAGTEMLVGTGVPLEIVAWSYCGFNNYDGLIDEFRLYNKALSEEKIVALYNCNSYENQAPLANAGGPYIIGIGDELIFDASQSSDPDAGDNLTYSWDLNQDGIFDDAVGVNPSISWSNMEISFQYPADIYSNEPVNRIALKVTDRSGLESICEAEVRIYRNEPVAVINADLNSAYINQEITFAGNSSYHLYPNRIINQYEWDFGDGTTALGESVVHAFNEAGTYTISLTVYDNNSNPKSNVTQLIIQVNNRNTITCFLEPQQVLNVGACWRLTTGADTSWKSSGEVLKNLANGIYTMTFKSVAGWVKPLNQSKRQIKHMF
ncbi:MAG: hypothetical protein ACD_79C00380G0001 [uncultured bacterium]|nr:MAG: hypothetical protein ACD_79C00380G0001 [uncultured bacterium]